MKNIINQQLLLSIQDFFIELVENQNKKETNINDVFDFISKLKDKKDFFDSQELYNEEEFLNCIDFNFEKYNLYNLFSSDKKKAKEIVGSIFSNKTNFSKETIKEIEDNVKFYYQKHNIDILVQSGDNIINSGQDLYDTNYFSRLSTKIEAHKIKEGLGIIYSVILKDASKDGEKAINESKEQFFNYINKNIIGSKKDVFTYCPKKDTVNVELCSHNTVFDAFIRNKNNEYSILIATNSTNSKLENETPFTHSISALYLTSKIENNLLPIKNGDYSSIKNLIEEQKKEINLNIEKLNSELISLEKIQIDAFSACKRETDDSPYNQILLKNYKNDYIFKNLISRLDPEYVKDNIDATNGTILLSKDLTAEYINQTDKEIRKTKKEKRDLLTKLNSDKKIVEGIVDFSNLETNSFISNNINIIQNFLPTDFINEKDNLSTFRNLVIKLNNNTLNILKDLDVPHNIDKYGNMILTKESTKEITNLFDENNLTVRFYGRNQGKKQHAYLNKENQSNETKEEVSYILGQYTYLDFLMSGKNGVRMDFGAGLDFIESTLLRNTITETKTKGQENKPQVIFHNRINDPAHTRKIVSNILKDYLFDDNKDSIIQILNKDNKDSNNQVDETTLKYINSIIEGFWVNLSHKIDENMTSKDINSIYFEACGELNIEVKKPLADVINNQMEIQNSPNNNKAKNSTIIAELKYISNTIKMSKISSFISVKEDDIIKKETQEIKKMIQMGISKEQIKELKPEFEDEKLNSLFNCSKKNKIK